MRRLGIQRRRSDRDRTDKGSMKPDLISGGELAAFSAAGLVMWLHRVLQRSTEEPTDGGYSLHHPQSLNYELG